MSYILTKELKPISFLFDQKRQQAFKKISYLNHNQYKDEISTAATLKLILSGVLLKPVQIGEPVVGQPSPSLIDRGPKYGSIDGYRVTLTFPFTGSSELLEYTPDSGIGGQSLRILQPDDNGCLSVELELGAPDQQLALREGHKYTDTTFDLVRKQVREVTLWNEQITKEVENELRRLQVKVN